MDTLCQEFAGQWQAGIAPEIETFLLRVPNRQQKQLLSRLLRLEIRWLERTGRAPRLATYLSRFGDFTDVVEEVFLNSQRDEETQAVDHGGPPAGGADPVPGGPSSAVLAPGTRVRRYLIKRLIGQGTFGEVYLARHELLDKEFALKLPRPESFTPEQAQRFVEEARALAKLDHPGIVAVQDADVLDDGRPFVAMAYVQGESLALRLKRGRLPPRDACGLTAQVADAIHHAHVRGFYHRDLKPANILLDCGGHPQVVDFGLALRVEEQFGHQGEFAGTLAYMAPEQVRGGAHRLDGRADIWSLGVILYEMLTGQRPFRGANEADLKEAILFWPPRPPRQMGIELPPALETVLERCCQKAIESRYASAAELAAALRTCFPEPETPGVDGSADAARTRESAKPALHSDSDADVKAEQAIVPGKHIGASSSKQLPTAALAALMAVALTWTVWVLVSKPATSSRDQSSTAIPAAPNAGVQSSTPDKPAESPETTSTRVPRATSALCEKPDEPAGTLPAAVVPAGPAVSAPRPEPPSLSAEFDVLVWDPRSTQRRGMSIRDAQARPLQPDDQIRISVTVNRPAYVYLLWIDSVGKLSPVYPWAPGDWTERPADEVPIQSLSLPKDVEQGWPMTGPAGMESLVLLARDSPLPSSIDLRDLLGQFPVQRMHHPQALVWFHDGVMTMPDQDVVRGPKFFDPQGLHDPLLQTHQTVAKKLRALFGVIRAVSFANYGE
jgi:serine/threonine protein kinase